MSISGRLFQTIVDVESSRERECVSRRRYGVIEIIDQQLAAIHLRPFPKLVSVSEVHWTAFLKRQKSASTSLDRVMLYYNQPIMHTNFLALKYFVSDYKATLASIAVSLSVLDWVAKIKRTDAIVSEISNQRIQDRHLAHFGWEQHLHDSKKRHWIKRFYGQYADSFLFQTINQKAVDESQNENRSPSQSQKSQSHLLPFPSAQASTFGTGQSTPISK